MNSIWRGYNLLKDRRIRDLLSRGASIMFNRHVSPLLPRKKASYNGVTVLAPQHLESFSPWGQIDDPHYESGLVSMIETSVDEGDFVVIVGGGWGVTAVKAAQRVGESGEVLVYEGSKTNVELVRETVELNDVTSKVTVQHAVVGPLISLRGEAGDAKRLPAEELPSCDVLELDCEGSEVEILENMDIMPRTILVETHGMKGAPSDRVETILKKNSYAIESKKVADRGRSRSCEENDIFAIACVRQ